jgi:hypothetical protein
MSTVKIKNMKKNMGRPKLPKGKAKTLPFVIKLSGEDSRTIEASIKESGQTKADWARGKLLWGLQRENVWSTQWKSKDLDGKTVRFKMMETPNRYVSGTGKFITIQRGDGSLDVRIFTRDKNDPDPYGYNDIPVTQRGIDLLRQSPPGSDCDFLLIDPSVP